MRDRTTCEISNDVHKRLKAYAKENGRIIYSVINEAVLEKIEQKENIIKN